MNYKIIGDSCLDLPENLKQDRHFLRVPLTIKLGPKRIIDDDFFNQKDFLTQLEESSDCPQTACPPPGGYLKAYEGEEKYVFVVTLSKELSGSYNSAVLAKKLYEEEYGPNVKKIEVIDSESASGGEFKIALLVQKLCEQGLNFEEIINKVSKFRDKMKTYFVLDSLDLLRKSGRLSGLKGKLADVLNIKLVMGSEKGYIKKIFRDRGIYRTLQKMCKTVADEVENIKDKVIVITHINNLERAQYVKIQIQKYCTCKDIVIMNGGGISTVYAGNGGIILAI